jgi:hypothetical protein
MKQHLFWFLAFLGAVLWIKDLRQRLQDAQMRGDMYQATSTRLERRISEITQPPA